MATDAKGYGRNIVGFVANYVMFGCGLAFFGSSTVMPLYLSHLTESKALIGLVTAIFPLGWMLPQLFAARRLTRSTRRKPLLVYLSFPAPLIYFALAALMFAGASGWLLPGFILGMAVLALSDGTLGVPWLDFIGSAIPGAIRGRMMGVQEVLFGVASLGVGAVVGHFLGEAAPAYPNNFAWLAIIAAGAFSIALLCMLILKEPEPSAVGEGATENQLPWSEYTATLGQILHTDRPFVGLVGLRVLNGLAGLATPFYMLYATEHLGLPASAAGIYLSVQMVTSALGSLVMGELYGRYGSRLVLRISTLAGVLSPLAALALPWLGLHGVASQAVFALVFLSAGLNGTSSAAQFIGYTNYLYDYTSPQQRPVYLGLFNTLAGPVALAGMVGGALLEHTSYTALFALTLTCLLAAQVLASRLPEPHAAC